MFTKKFWLDLLERSIWTFVQAFVGVLLAQGLVVEGDVDWKAVLVSAAIAGGVAVAKCILATRIGNRQSAATLPASAEQT